MTEEYSPQKHEEGTPEASGWAKSMTPGQENSDGFPAGKKGKSEPKKKLKTFVEHLDVLDEAEYQGREVTLDKPTRGDVKKFKVYVKDPKTGNVKKVNFGHGGTSAKGKTMSIKKDHEANKASYCARSAGIEGGGKDKTKANYWSRQAWDC